MEVLSILLVIVACGVLLWLVNSYIPMDAKIARILNIVVVILLILFLLKVFGVWAALSNFTI